MLRNASSRPNVRRISTDVRMRINDMQERSEEQVLSRLLELENEGGRLIYSYELKVAGRSGVEEVNVDAKSGKVVSTEHESAKSEAKEAAQEKKETKKPAKPTR